VLREPGLPVASHDEVSRELKLLTDRRDVLVAQRTSAINRLRWHVHELEPARAPGRLDAAKHQHVLQVWLATMSGLVAELARAELADIIRLTATSPHWPHVSANASVTLPNMLGLPGCAS